MTRATDPSRPSLRAAATASAADLALSLPLILLENDLAGGTPGPAPAAVAVAVLRALAVLGVRRHPLAALLAVVGLDAAGELVGAPVGLVGMLYVVYVATRYAVPHAAAALVVAVAAVPAAAAAPTAGSPPDALARLGEELAVLGPWVLVAAFAGWQRRTLVRRREFRLERAAGLRRERAMLRERERIVDELNGVVVGALRRVAALASGCRDRLARPAPEPARALAELQAEARGALAAMRRVLVVLRAAPPDGPGAGPGREPGARVPPPGTSGVVLAAVTAALAGLASLIPSSVGPPLDAELAPGLVVDPTAPAPLVLLAVQIGTLGWWRTAPQAAFLVGSSASAAAALGGMSNVVADTSWFALALGLVAGAPARRSVPLLVATTAGLSTLALLLGLFRTPSDGVVGLGINLVVLAVLLPFGAAQRRSRLARAATESAADRETRRVVEQERHRIARELHDVVAHFVSAVAVQAGAARTVVDRDPAAVAEAAAHIEDHGRRIRAALPELADLAPPTRVVPPTAAEVQELVAPLRAAGVRVTAEVHGTPAPGDGDTALFAHRILTEALTNVLRHAGPGSSAHVVVEHRPGDLSLRISDTGPAAPSNGSHGGPGLGLVGMRERAHLLGGEVTAGPDGRGGWTVTAHLRRGPTPAAPRGAPIPPDEEDLDDDRGPAGAAPLRPVGPRPGPTGLGRGQR